MGRTLGPTGAPYAAVTVLRRRRTAPRRIPGGGRGLTRPAVRLTLKYAPRHIRITARIWLVDRAVRPLCPAITAAVP